MTFRINTNSCKNAMGTVFLLAAAFFVCSTLISMRSVFADPIIANDLPNAKSSRQSPRSAANTTNKATVSRSAVSRSTTARSAGSTSKATVSRGVATRTTNATRSNASRSAGAASRSVTSRSTGGATTNRAIRARTSTTPARVSVAGSAMTGTRASVNSTYSYLTSRLYTGSYSDIIDSSTGLISADAYANCMDSYYTCMDEICTARSDTKGRCSCAGRATNFLEAEKALETANEELIKLSGQLSLLIATKGKGNDISAAFSLTDAEKVMNCVSYKEAADKDAWCEEHPSFDENGNLKSCGMPSYCSNNTFGFDIGNIDGSSSDILAQLKAWADAKDLAKEYTITDNDSLNFKTSNLVAALSGISGIVSTNEKDLSLDTLANKWGYQLFEYAHNNVCGRVLDSCFNGIYEACGTPVDVTDSDGKKHSRCANGATTNCPFNYNSYISVDTNGDVALKERNSNNTTATSSASCFGYTTTTTNSRSTTTTSSDPYYNLRGPVADARRSIMQKYLLDANASCDVYGAALKQTAQNINYQKIAAEQALQQKRLEFKQEADATALSEATAAIDNFNECISEIWDCYNEYQDESGWTTARIKAYCSQVSQVPHCYETMICSPLQTQLTAVIDLPDNSTCTFSTEYNKNTCRNVVTISEILYGTGVTEWENNGKIDLNGESEQNNKNSAAIREYCLQQALGGEGGCNSTNSDCLRGWKKPSNSESSSN